MCRSCRFLGAVRRLGEVSSSAAAAGRPVVSRRRLVGGARPGGAALASGAQPKPVRAQTPVGADGPASVVFRGGRVYTVDPGQPWAEAVAVRDGEIVAVGGNAEIDALVGPATTLVELDGRMVLPGFVEAHTHPALGAFATSGVDLQVSTREDALAAIADYAKANPEGPVRGFGWRWDMFGPEGPNKADLDRVVPDRPAFFFAIDMHSLWMNSKALEAAGITRDTPDPAPGFSYYVRDADGEPTGWALEAAASLGAVNAIQPITAEAMSGWLQAWMPKAAAAGITTVFDALSLPINGDQAATIEVYRDLEDGGLLPFRVFACFAIDTTPFDHAVPTALDLRDRIASDLVRVQTLKIVSDGTPENYTALMLEPYADKPDSRGESPFTPADLASLIAAADAEQLDIHIHALGDGSVRVALDGFEAAIAANPGYERRHTVAHLILVDDADTPRFAELGVVAQFSANWFSADPDTEDILLKRFGPERQQRLYRPRSVLDTGAVITFGTDWPAAGYVSTYKPLDSLQIAVTRQLIGEPDAPVLEPVDERLDLAQAIRANTLGGAHQLRMEDRIGSIAPGKLADLVVLERNLFDVDPHDIAATRIDLTMMNGRFTHGDPTSSA